MKRILLFTALAGMAFFSGTSYAQTVNSSETATTTNDITAPVNDNDNYMIPNASEGVAAISGFNDLLVYPNPVVSSTRIALEQVPGSNVYVDIVDMNGVVDRTFQYAPGTYQLDVNMGNLPMGMYSIRVSGRDIGYHNLKVIKQ